MLRTIFGVECALLEVVRVIDFVFRKTELDLQTEFVNNGDFDISTRFVSALIVFESASLSLALLFDLIRINKIKNFTY